jgi:hypothetical protein
MGAHHLQWRLHLADGTAPTGFPAPAEFALRIPRCRLAKASADLQEVQENLRISGVSQAEIEKATQRRPRALRSREERGISERDRRQGLRQSRRQHGRSGRRDRRNRDAARLASDQPNSQGRTWDEFRDKCAYLLELHERGCIDFEPLRLALDARERQEAEDAMAVFLKKQLQDA